MTKKQIYQLIPKTRLVYNLIEKENTFIII